MELRWKKFRYTDYVILFLTTLAITKAETETNCTTCIKINTTCYNLTYLFDLQGNFRNQIVIHKFGLLRSEDTLFFTYEPDIKDTEYYKLGFVDLVNPNNTGIVSAQNIPLNFGTFDMDQEGKIIYLGGSDGVFKFDTKINSLSHYSSRGDRILSVFFKTYVYFVRADEKEIIQKKGKDFDSILIDDRSVNKTLLMPKLTVKDFVITQDNVVVFLTTYGLFASYATKDSEAFLLSKQSFFRGLTVDLDGLVYAWWIDGIYRVVIEKDLKTSTVVKVADIPSIGAMTFDNNNNFLFSAERALYRLAKTDLVKC